MDDILKEIEPYVAMDEPVPYKGINIYPIKLKNYFKFKNNSDILQIDKNRSGKIELIQMNYLNFFFSLLLNSLEYRVKFMNLLSLCLHIDYDTKSIDKAFDFGEVLHRQTHENKHYFFINGYGERLIFIQNDKLMSFYINGVVMTSLEFQKMVRIILYQNIYGYDDEPMSDDVREVVEKYYATKNKGIKPVSIDDKVIAVMSCLGISKGQLLNETIITIEKLFGSINKRDGYFIEHQYRSHAMTDKKLPDIEHWVYQKDTQKYSDIFTDADAFKNKINMEEYS